MEKENLGFRYLRRSGAIVARQPETRVTVLLFTDLSTGRERGLCTV